MTDLAPIRAIVPVAVVLLVALVISGCGENGDSIDPGAAADAPDYTEALEAAPPPLAQLYGEGEGEILDGGLAALEKQIEALEGTPVLVNKWASWCGPCREEFPYLQQEAADHADEVAFIGINSNDSQAAAETFLRDHPIPYPSFFDPDEEIAFSFDAVSQPVTLILDADGEVVHKRTGPYDSREELAADIDRYALGT